jgi:hypothetical protein
MPITTQPIENWGDAIFLALTNAINTFLAAIPAVLGAIVILIIGWVLSGIVARLVSGVLRKAGADRMFAEHGGAVYGERSRQFQPSIVAGEIVKWAIRIVFLVAAANALGMPQVSQLLNQVLLWIPNLIVAAIILLVAPLVARFVGGAIETGAGSMGFTNARLLGQIAQWAIIGFAVVIAINQIGIAENLINTLFIGLVAALALAFGLAFGLGGRDVAGEMTRSWYESSQSTAARVRERAAQAQAEGAARSTERATTLSPAQPAQAQARASEPAPKGARKQQPAS